MAITDIEVGLSDEQRSIRDSARKFADEVLRPAGIALDRLPDPAQVIAPDSPLWRVFEKSRELGLEQLETGATDLPPGEAARVRYLVNEEMGRGDSGLAISLAVAGFHRIFAQMSGRPALIERFCGESSREIGCWAIWSNERTRSTGSRTSSAISSGVGSRSYSWKSRCCVRISLVMVSMMFAGMRIVRVWSPIERAMAWRIHHVA